ncbi:MAG TPA: 50S ribosomal protein L22, partial [Blastocatellia bacterium]|nr:50S ribosomal protein L22 [Blastocatellia bacterium]
MERQHLAGNRNNPCASILLALQLPAGCWRTKDMEAHASARNVKGSSQKVKLVIDLIRGRKVNEALSILKFTNKRATHPIEMVLRSAIANATVKAEAANVIVDPDDLFVTECFVGKGDTKNRRRVRPAPMGRAYRE